MDIELYKHGKRVKLEHEKLYDHLMRFHGVVVPNAYTCKLSDLLKENKIEHTAEKVDKWGSQWVYRLK